MSYERPNIRRMRGYAPGEQPQSTAPIKLNTNENPYPPAAAVLEAVHGIDAETLRRYPSPTSAAFRAAAARIHAIASDNLVCTNGGDELLRLAITTFVEPGRPVGMAEPSYSLYPVLAAIHGSPVERVELRRDWSLPEDFAARMNAAGVQLTFLVNPHAPSGTLYPADEVAALAAALDGVLLVDEAYVDFVDPVRGHDTLPLIRAHDNLLVLRTLSKGYSLAGLRFGYGVGAADLIAPIAEKTRDSYSVDAIAERAAIAAVEHRAEAAETWAAVRQSRSALAAELESLGLPCAPSESNFLLAQIPEGVGGGAEAIYRALKAQDIIVRYFDQPRLRDRLRISVGTPEQNGKLLSALRSIVRG